MFRKLALSTAAAMMVVAPVAASAAPARTSAAVDESQDLRGNSGVLLPVIVAIALAIGIILLIDDDNPTSP
jgi:hypothetical protein